MPEAKTKHQYDDREDGLLFCRVCHGGEGALPSECPGSPMTATQQADVYSRRCDYQQGQWLPIAT